MLRRIEGRCIKDKIGNKGISLTDIGVVGYLFIVDIFLDKDKVAVDNSEDNNELSSEENSFLGTKLL